ncbi:YlxR family protein [Nitriliruptor sp.]|uniref:YlxR family protein n=1 Tax=Nitriliruptor sp. TaxID=2448056 RepID=UPI0034A04FAD
MREPRPTDVGPVRTCVGCRRTRPRDELARLARTPAGVRYDRRRRASGRGANICPELSCIEAAGQRGAGPVRRALRGAPETEIRAALDELRCEVAAPTTTRPRVTGSNTPSAG